jgi:heme/copper-type cytochrome/quinol oxidase subunit 2
MLSDLQPRSSEYLGPPLGKSIDSRHQSADVIALPLSVFHDMEDATIKASLPAQKRLRSLLSADYVFVAAIAIVIGCNFYFGPRIRRERIAMQWGSDGKPTWHARRWVALWWMIPFMIAARCIVWLASTYAP